MKAEVGSGARVSVGIHVFMVDGPVEEFVDKIEVLDLHRYALGYIPDRPVVLIWPIDQDPHAELARHTEAGVNATGGEVAWPTK